MGRRIAGAFTLLLCYVVLATWFGVYVPFVPRWFYALAYRSGLAFGALALSAAVFFWVAVLSLYSRHYHR